MDSSAANRTISNQAMKSNGQWGVGQVTLSSYRQMNHRNDIRICNGFFCKPCEKPFFVRFVSYYVFATRSDSRFRRHTGRETPGARVTTHYCALSNKILEFKKIRQRGDIFIASISIHGHQRQKKKKNLNTAHTDRTLSKCGESQIRTSDTYPCVIIRGGSAQRGRGESDTAR